MLLQVRIKCLWEEKMLILPSHLKILSDFIDQLFLGHLFPSGCGVAVGVVVSHQFQSMLHRDLMLSHKVVDPRVYFFNVPCFCGFSPG